MDLDFSGMKEVTDYVTVPEGTYLCRVAEVYPGVTRNGDDRWALRLVVAEGEFVGRQAAWDGLVFSDRGLIRARRVLGALGLPTEGRVRLEPEDVVGREALVTVRPTDYRDPRTNESVRRNEVPYDGYRAVLDDDAVPPAGEDGSEDADGRSMPF